MRRAAVLTALALGVLAVALVWQHNRSTRATVGKVADAAWRGEVLPPRVAAAQQVDGVGFPDWSARGWRLTGGRRDVIGGRDAVTVVYRRGGRSITYTLLEGADSVNDGAATWSPSYDTRAAKLELNWQGRPDGVMAARVVPRGGHQFILTGRPGSEALRREMTRLAAIGPAV